MEKTKSFLVFSKFFLQNTQYFFKEFSPLELSSLISPPRFLRVTRLPEPPFHTYSPPLFFWHPLQKAESEDSFPFPLVRDTRQDEPQRLMNHAVLNETLPLKGKLKQDSQGFVYIDLPHCYFEELLPLLPDEKIEKPSYGGSYGPLGAHFPVILAKEWTQCHGLGEIELEKDFSFDLLGIFSMPFNTWPGIEKVWFLKVDCPEAEQLRERYLLPSKIQGHSFHIVIGVKSRLKQEPLPKETFRINVSCYAL